MKACRYCAREIISTNVKKHEKACPGNPATFTWCPVCGGPKKNKASVTCSYACSNTFFRRGPRAEAKNNYRSITFKHHSKECVVCGEDKIVACHHMNGDHYDNRPENLVPLCPTHHGYWHSKWRYLIEDKVRAYQEQFFERMILEADNENYDLHSEELGEVAEVEF